MPPAKLTASLGTPTTPEGRSTGRLIASPSETRSHTDLRKLSTPEEIAEASARPWLGALLLGYYDPDGRLVYAGRVGTGIDYAELGRLWRRLQSLATSKMPLEVAPPRSNRFGAPLVLSRVHWVRPELVVEVKYLTWTGDNLLCQVV